MSHVGLSVERPLLLASGSPRRLDLLTGAGISCLVRPPHVDESVLSKEPARTYVERIATAKLARALFDPPSSCPAILVADTTVALAGEILGKPADSAEALSMVTALSGREHEVLTCYAIRCVATGREITRTVSTRVSLRAASDQELREYVATGEGLDKAGSYAIQGRGACLVSRIEGSYTNVVGLPLAEVVVDLRSLGLLGS